MPDQTPEPFTAGPASSYVPVVAELTAERAQLAAQLAAIRDLAKLWTRDPNAPEHDCGVDILKTLSRFDSGTAQPDCPHLADVLAGRAQGSHDDSTCGWCARIRSGTGPQLVDTQEQLTTALDPDEHQTVVDFLKAYIRLCGSRLPDDHRIHAILAKLTAPAPVPGSSRRVPEPATPAEVWQFATNDQRAAVRKVFPALADLLKRGVSTAAAVRVWKAAEPSRRVQVSVQLPALSDALCSGWEIPSRAELTPAGESQASEPATETKVAPSAPRCPSCGSPRWVSVSLNGGYTRKAQCVPCGAYHPGIIGPGWRSSRASDPEAVHPAYREQTGESQAGEPARDDDEAFNAQLFAGIPEQLARLVAEWQAHLQSLADKINRDLVRTAAPKLAQGGIIARPKQAGKTAEQLAQLFHETYELLAPRFGYRTRESSAKPWAEVPENNRALMIATCARVLVALNGGPDAPPSPPKPPAGRPQTFA